MRVCESASVRECVSVASAEVSRSCGTWTVLTSQPISAYITNHRNSRGPFRSSSSERLPEGFWFEPISIQLAAERQLKMRMMKLVSRCVSVFVLLMLIKSQTNFSLK